MMKTIDAIQGTARHCIACGVDITFNKSFMGFDDGEVRCSDCAGQRLHRENQKWLARIHELETRLAAAEEVVRHYADAGNWEGERGSEYVKYHGYDKAREYLNKYAEGERVMSIIGKEACPDCTNYGMAYGKGGWWVTRWWWGIIPVREWRVCETCDGTGRLEATEGK